MNTVGAAASSAGDTHVHTSIYVYNVVRVLYDVYILYVHQRKKRLCQDHKINTLVTLMRSVTPQNILNIHITYVQPRLSNRGNMWVR